MRTNRRLAGVFVCALLVMPQTVQPAAAQCESAVVAPEQVGSGDYWVSMDMDGRFAVAGESYDSAAGTHSGVACVYQYVEGDWVLLQKLFASDADAHARFGERVQIDGDVLAVSAVHDDEHGPASGAVYVFRFDGTVWVEEAKLSVASGASASFGSGLALDGHRLAIGADRNDEIANNAGAVYVFEYDGSAWVQRHQLFASDAAESDYFGSTVALDGTTLMAQMRGSFVPIDPEVRVFEFDGATWNETQALGTPGVEFDGFGEDIAISDGLVAIGASGTAGWTDEIGAVHLFSRDDDEWVPNGIRYPVVADENHWFGRAVALDEETLLVGAPGDDSGGALNAGSISVFERQGAEISLVPVTVYSSDPQQWDSLGGVLAIDGDRAVGRSSRGQHDSMHIIGGLRHLDCDHDGMADACVIGQGLDTDCNANFVPDQCDIASGTSRDGNGNAIPDECATDAGVYIGPLGGAWHDPANWSGQVVPDATVPVRIETWVVISGSAAMAAAVDLRAGGHIDIDGASLSASVIEIDEAASMKVSGTINGDVFLDGTLVAAVATRDIVVNGSIVFGSYARFETTVEPREFGIDLAGLVVSDVALLDGTVSITIENDESLSWGDASSLVASSLRSGAFAAEFVEVVPIGTQYELAAHPTGLDLVFQRDMTPDPCRVGLLAAPDDELYSICRLATHGSLIVACFRHEGGERRVAVFRRVNGAFQFEAFLDAPVVGTDHKFGHSLAVADNMIIVGAPEYGPGIPAGAVFVYVYDPDAGGPSSPWRAARRIDGALESGLSEFGERIASDGRTVLVRARCCGGWVQLVYRIVDDALEKVAVLTTADPRAVLDYGGAVSGKWAAVKTDTDGEVAPLQLFRETADLTWESAGLLSPPDDSVRFGNGLVMHGDLLCAGDPFLAGMWIYRLIDDTWTLEAKLEPDWLALFNSGGTTNVVALDDDRAIIGGWQSIGSGPVVRVVTQFRFDGATWREYSTTIVDAQSSSLKFSVLGDTMVASTWKDGIPVLALYAGFASGDCNANGIPDGCDIASGLLADIDLDGIPDECDEIILAGDIDGNGAVDGHDLSLLLAAWGPCVGPCPADLDGDGLVGDTDLALLLAFLGL